MPELSLSTPTSLRGDDDVYYYIGERLKLEGETENMGVWTKKRGSLKAVGLMATPCPKSLHGKGEKWIALRMLKSDETRATFSRTWTRHSR